MPSPPWFAAIQAGIETRRTLKIPQSGDGYGQAAREVEILAEQVRALATAVEEWLEVEGYKVPPDCRDDRCALPACRAAKTLARYVKGPK